MRLDFSWITESVISITYLLQYHSTRHLEHLFMASPLHTAQVEGSRNCSPNVLTHLATRKNAQIFKLRCILRGPPFGQLLDSLDVRLQHERDMSGCYGIPLVYVGPQYLLTDHWHLQHKTEILQRGTQERESFSETDRLRANSLG